MFPSFCHLNIVLSKINNRETITFRSDKELHHIKLNDILYLYRDTALEKTIVVTKTNEYAIREPLSALASKLGNKFYKTHRACCVNLDMIKKVDYKNKYIYFVDGSKIDYLSRNYLKILKEVLQV